MNQIRMVFSDIDGTLLNSEHQMTERTSSAIRRLHRHGIPFVFISARSREGIYPILQEHNLTCPVVACNGAMILDENGSVLHTTVMPWSVVREVLYELENGRFDAAWNLYTTEGLSGAVSTAAYRRKNALSKQARRRFAWTNCPIRPRR